MYSILIINGPSLNLVGRREPEIYGSRSLDSYLEELCGRFNDRAEIQVAQSNHEGEIIDLIHNAMLSGDIDGIVINPGAYSHTSLAIADALRAVDIPAVEVHISNIHSREEFRRRSVTGAAARAVVAGFGLLGYDLAVEGLLELLEY